MTLDFVTQNVYINDELVILSKKEFGLLAHMAQSSNQIIESATLFQLKWAQTAWKIRGRSLYILAIPVHDMV